MSRMLRNARPLGLAIVLMLASVSCDDEAGFDEDPELEGEREGEEEEPPTDEEQLREQERRAKLVRDIDPSEWQGWEADGVAKFATPSLEQAEDGEARGLGTPDDEIEGSFVLADGRKFKLTRQVIEATEGDSGEPSEYTEPDEERSPAAVLGIDSRTFQGWSNMTKYPWRSTGTILVNSNSTSGFCTAALISPRVAITAGHCVYNYGAWSWNTWFSPGHHGTGWFRYPNGTPRAVVGLLSNTAWVNNYDADHDIGFLILADAPNTASLGYFGFGAWDTDDLEGKGFGMLQYPSRFAQCAASPLSSGLCGAFMYYAGSTINNDCGNLLEHRADTNPGSSGSPVYRWISGGRYIMGPHAYGRSPCDYDDNKAVALTNSKVKHACNLFLNFPSAYHARFCF